MFFENITIKEQKHVSNLKTYFLRKILQCLIKSNLIKLKFYHNNA